MLAIQIIAIIGQFVFIGWAIYTLAVFVRSHLEEIKAEIRENWVVVLVGVVSAILLLIV